MVISKEVELNDAFARTIEGQQPSLAFTDRITVTMRNPATGEGISIDDDCTSNPCLKPADNVIRIGFLDLASVLFALAGAFIVKIKGGTVAETVKPGAEDIVFLSIEGASSFNKAHQSYRNGDIDATRDHLRHAFENAGYTREQADQIVQPIISGFEALERGDGSEAAFKALVALNQAKKQNVDLTDLSSRLVKMIELFLGDILNIGDAIPSILRGLMELPEPTDITKTKVSVESDPRTIIGVVQDQEGNLVPEATVQVYRRNPQEASEAEPYAVATTDSNGRFQTEEAGPRNRTYLWFDVREGDQLLTQQPRVRTYRPDGGIPGIYGYQFHVNRAMPEDRPEVNVNLTDLQQLQDGRISFKLDLAVKSGELDVTPWNSAGGVHVRISEGTFDEVSPGDFTSVYGGNQLRQRVDNLDEASIIELVTENGQTGRSLLQTGELVVAPPEIDEITIGYRAWGFDTDVPLKIDGQSQPYIARAPAGPEYNRHEIEEGYTFLNYPVRAKTVTLQPSEGSTAFNRIFPRETEVTVAPGTTVHFELGLSDAGEEQFPTSEWFVDGSLTAEPRDLNHEMFPHSRDFYHHDFNTPGTYTVEGALIPDGADADTPGESDSAPEDRVAWTVHVEDGGNTAPTISPADPTDDVDLGPVDDPRPGTVTLQARVTDSEGNLDRVYWRLTLSDKYLGATAATGETDTVAMELPVEELATSHGGALELMAVDAAGALRQRLVWEIDLDRARDHAVLRPRTASGDGTDDTTWHTLTIDGQGTNSRTDYSVTVSGNLKAKEGIGTGDSIRGSTAEGFTRGGDDVYQFTGDLRDYNLQGGDAILTVDGDRRGTADGETDDDEGDTEWHTLTIDGQDTGSRTDYSVTVSGQLEAKAGIGNDDSIRGSTAEGFTRGGDDVYRFTGELRDYDLEGGDAVLSVDGDRVAQASGGSSDTEWHTLTIDGQNTGSRTDYTVTVSGKLQAGDGVGSGDTITGSTAEGFTRGGSDTYRFTGELKDFTLTGGDAVLTVDGDRVAQAGGASDTEERTFPVDVW